MRTSSYFILLIQYWINSFAIAVLGYYLLYFILPDNKVFEPAHWFFMSSAYHLKQPIPFITIMCFFYGIVATLFTNLFKRSKLNLKIIFISQIIFITILLSEPFGGMLVFYLDMRAGNFPGEWISIMCSRGISNALVLGWPVILSSFPYSELGMIVCFFLTNFLSARFRKTEETIN